MLSTGAALTVAEATRAATLRRPLSALRAIPLRTPGAFRAISLGAAGAVGPVAGRTPLAIMPRPLRPALPVGTATVGPARMGRAIPAGMSGTIPAEPACALAARPLGALAALGELHRLMLGARLAGAAIALHALRRAFRPIAGAWRPLIASTHLLARPTTAIAARPPCLTRTLTGLAATAASTGSPALAATAQQLPGRERQT